MFSYAAPAGTITGEIMITIADVLARIAVIQREIISPDTGAAMVSYDNIPYTISGVDMPLFVNFAKPMTKSDIIGEDAKGRDFNDTRNYDMILYHSGYGQGVEQEKSGALTPYFDLMLNKFGAYPHLKGLPGVLDAQITSDSGSVAVNFVGQSYFGARFTLTVITKVRRPLASLE